MRNTVRTSVLLCLTLVCALIVTGFVSSGYKRERVGLGRLHFDRGRDLAKHGEEEAAIEEYRQALIFSPDITEYRLALATALTESGQLDEAESHLQQLQQQDPTNGSINLMVARLAVKRKSPQAVEAYQRAVYQYWAPDQLSERRKARWELIGLLESQNRRSEIVGELMQMYAGLGPDPKQKKEVGFSLLSNGAVSEASQVFRDLVHDRPQDADAHRGMGEVLFGLADYVEARHEFQRALRLSPGDKATQQDLTLTNSVIDMNPNLPHINSAERLRRSRNLLKAVIGELERCSKAHGSPDSLDKSNTQVNTQVNNGKALLTERNASKDDLSLELQDAAQELWSKRVPLCGTAANDNRAVEVAVAGVAQ